MMRGVSFSIAGHAAWAPGLTSADAWARWAEAPFAIASGVEPGAEPGVKAMPAMLRRRAGFLGKMALEVAYQCLDGRSGVTSIFCSRHGDVARALDLLLDRARGEPLSPTGFGMAVHNATAGMFTIARADRSNHIALAAGAATVEHAVIEACGLLTDGAPSVLLVACDCPLPELFAPFEDCEEQPHAWAWLMAPADAAAAGGVIRLDWRACVDGDGDDEPGETVDADGAQPGALQVLAFQLGGAAALERTAGKRRWRWSRDV